jgi:hypothetical protein
MRQADLDNWFLYHPPTNEQMVAYSALRNKAKELAEDFDRFCPDCADKTAAMRDLRGTLMAMNLAIACYQKPTVESLEAILKSEEKPPIYINPDGSISAEAE